ncbi:MAG: hypothetical protein ACOYON_10715 [Fimbriimonas sp.]
MLVPLAEAQSIAKAVEGKRITLEAKAQTADKLLATLGQKLGLTLEATPQTKSSILILRLQDAPADQVLEKIAYTISASWRREGPGYRLVRDAGQTLAMRQKEEAQEAESYRKAQVKLAEELTKQGVFGPTEAKALAKEFTGAVQKTNNQEFNAAQWQRMNALEKRGPANRLIKRMLLTLNPRDLAAIEARTKVVLSSRPNKMQFPLDRRALAAIDQYVREQNTWAEAAATVPTESDDENAMWESGLRVRKSLPEPPDKVLLTISRYSAMGSVQFEVLLADATGKIITRATDSLDTMSEQYQGIGQEKPKPDDPVIELSAESKEFAAMLRGSFARQGGKVQMSPELRAKLLQPEEHDPLSFVSSDIMLGIGKAKNVNLIVEGGDLDIILANPEGSGFTLNRSLALAGIFHEMEEKDGFLIMKQKNPIRSARFTIDRKLLGMYLRTIDKQGSINLEQKAEYAYRSKVEDFGIEMFLAQLIQGTSELEFSDDRLTLQLYGSLSRQQRQVALGEGLAIRSLLPEQRTLINRLVFGMNSNLNVEYTDGQMDQSYYNGLKRETTEALPEGIPLHAVLKMTDTSDEVLISGPKVTSQYTMPGRPMTPQDFAWQSFAQERPDLFPWMQDEYQQMDLSSLSGGLRRTIELSVKLTEKLSMSRNLTDTTKKGKASLSTMSKDFQDKVAAAIKNYRESYKDRTGGGLPRLQ